MANCEFGRVSEVIEEITSINFFEKLAIVKLHIMHFFENNSQIFSIGL